jgi:Fe2+ transport system protein FeoA
MSLDQLVPGESGIIDSVTGSGALRRRLLDMGLTPGTRVLVRKVAPFGDPIELSLRGYALTIRGEDAQIIRMRKVDA